MVTCDKREWGRFPNYSRLLLSSTASELLPLPSAFRALSACLFSLSPCFCLDRFPREPTCFGVIEDNAGTAMPEASMQPQLVTRGRSWISRRTSLYKLVQSRRHGSRHAISTKDYVYSPVKNRQFWRLNFVFLFVIYYSEPSFHIVFSRIKYVLSDLVAKY